MNPRPILAAILLSAIAALLICHGVENPGAREMSQQTENRMPDDKVLLSLQTESSILRKDAPYFVSLTIKNLSAEEFDLRKRATLSFEMAGQTPEQKKKFGPNFWSWIWFMNQMPGESRIKRRQTLLQGEELTLRLDLSKQKWGHSILSGYPSNRVFTSIPKGRYLLFFECEVNASNREKVRSNVASIQVK